ncbi:MAG: DUF6716 putative glycosyltransferase [Vicinamibacterales bacterium]
MNAAGDALRITTEAGERTVSLARYLGPDALEAAEDEANRWVKSLRHARVDGLPLRDRFTCRGDSLWWFMELYLHKERVVNSIFRTTLALESLVEHEQPRRMAPGSSSGVDPVLEVLGRQMAERRGFEWYGPGKAAQAGRGRMQRLLRNAYFHAAVSLANRLRLSGRSWRGSRPVEVAAFVHSAFWRTGSGEESYLGPVLREVERAIAPRKVELIGVGPRTNYRARSWRQRWAEFRDPQAAHMPWTPIGVFATRRSFAEADRTWRDRKATCRALWSSRDLRALSVIRGLDAWPLVRAELAGIAYLQFPWSVAAMDQAAAALDCLSPRVALTYAEAGGWGRALVLEARRRGIRIAGIQHGFIYRHWLNYLHEPDEMLPSELNPADRGFPCPHVTLLYDRFARKHLVERGRFPECSLKVTGNPKLDAFAAAGRTMTEADRRTVRTGLGAGPEELLVVVAAKFSQMGPVFAELVQAVAGMPGVRLVVKCHPAETPEPYERVAAGVKNVVVAPADTDLARLIAAASVLVTVNSTAAIEAMALDVPALVVALPNNLSPFVEAGAMAGLVLGQPLRPALEAILYDGDRRERLEAARRAFAERYGIVADGRAAARTAKAILQLGEAPPASIAQKQERTSCGPS